MNTLQAIKGSIQKWNDILTGMVKDYGESNCPLCKKFINNQCRGCPVKEKTGQISCMTTTYLKFVAHNNRRHWGDSICHLGCKTCNKTATAERDFLVSLLPKRKKG